MAQPEDEQHKDDPAAAASAPEGGAGKREGALARPEDRFDHHPEVEPYDDFEDEDEDAGADPDGEEVELTEWFDEQGRRHVRRQAPEGTAEILKREVARQTGLPDKVERWRQRSAVGAVATAFAFGLQSALEAERQVPAIIMETSGDPPTDLPVEGQLEQLGPRQSTVKVRQWLLGQGPSSDEQQPNGSSTTSNTKDQPDGSDGPQEAAQQ